jgi:16S rRNA processing protein RimM
MNIKDCYFLGKVTKPHALAGEVILWLDVDNPNDYENLTSVFLMIKNDLIPYFIENIQIRGKKSIAKFEDINKIEQTESIIGVDMYLPLTALPKLSGNKFYYHEVVGYKIVDNVSKKELGLLESIFDSTGQDLISMNCNGVEVLIPITDDIVKNVDRDGKILFVELPDGLIDIYLES